LATREEFERAITDIDAKLSARDVPIHARSLHALLEVARRLGIHEIVAVPTSVDPEDFSASALAGQVHRWYEQRYGNRLKKHPGPGAILVKIKGEAWEMRIPLLMGAAWFVCDPLTLGQPRKRAATEGKPVIYNVLDAVANITPALASSLSDAELRELGDNFVAGLGVFGALVRESGSPLVFEACADLETSVRMFIDRQNYRQSKWASLQFTEKLMKSHLKNAGTPFKRNHDLAELNRKVASLGYSAAQADLEAIQCPGGARYGEVAVSKDSSLQAHQAALRVAGNLGFSERLQ
jgi:hypothetical protein